MENMGGIVYEIKTPVKVVVEYAGEIPNSEVITTVIEKKTIFNRTKYCIKQVVPFVSRPGVAHSYINRLLESIAKRDYGIAELWILDKKNL